MGFQVTNLDEMRCTINSFEDNPEFLAIVLYRDSHKKFKEVFRQNFSMYHNSSSKFIHFFNFDKIESSSVSRYSSKSHTDNKVIDVILKQFNLSEEQMPLIILTKNIDSPEYGVINFKNNPSQEKIKEILDYIFIPFTLKNGGYEAEYKIANIKKRWDAVEIQKFNPDWMDYGEYREKITIRNKLLISLEDAISLLKEISTKFIKSVKE